MCPFSNPAEHGNAARASGLLDGPTTALNALTTVLDGPASALDDGHHASPARPAGTS